MMTNTGTVRLGISLRRIQGVLIAQETLYVPNGGETNVEQNSLASIVAKYDTTMAELRRYHWTFCGSQYAEEVTDKWRTNGAFAEMERVLGYRFQLVTASLPDLAQVGSSMPVQICLRNTGCAPLYNERPAYIVLRNEKDTFRLQLASDPRRWAPNHALTTIDETLTLPDEVPAGTYNLYLYLPDASDKLAADPRYAVRFGNKNVWDDNTGYNDLNASITISNSAPKDPGILPEGIEEVSPHSAVSCQKVLEDGQVLVLTQDGKKYTVNGQMVQ